MTFFKIVFIVSLLFFALTCGGDLPINDEPFQNWVRNAENPMVTGDGVNILNVNDPCLIYDDSMGKYRMWFGFVGVNVTNASIGYSESSDGRSWTTAVVVFSTNVTGSWDDIKVEIPFVLKDESETNESRKYKMWYGGSEADYPDLTKIGLAFSADGLTWTRLPADESLFNLPGLVMVAEDAGAGDMGVVAEPTIVLKDAVYHMWYNSWGANGLVISHATSSNGIHWLKDVNNPVLEHTDGSWESVNNSADIGGTVAQPTVIWNGNTSQFMMWYGSFDKIDEISYSGIGFAISTNGTHWVKHTSAVLIPDYSSGEENGIGTGPFVLYKDDSYNMWYGSHAPFGLVINQVTMQ